MANLNVATIGPQGYARDLGKLGTTTDITFYNMKRGEDTVTLIEPTRYPDRLAPLFFAVSMARKVILVVEELGPHFGESVVMLQCVGLKEGYIVLRNYLTPEDIAPLIRGTVLEDYEFVEDDTIALRERLLDEASLLEQAPPDATKGTIPVDHFFNVKGIGTVILGCVADGAIRKHDVLRVLPGDECAQIRSLQKHDDDFDWAGEGDRTGVALKNVDADELDRGTVLSNDDSIRSESSMKARAEVVNYWPSPLKEGMVIHLGHWMQFVPARIESIDNSVDWHRPMLDLDLEKPLIYLSGDKAVIHHLEGDKLRVVGTFQLP